MINNILFDLDDTIFDFHLAEKKALTKTLIHFNINPDKNILDRYSQINASQWKLLEQGKITREDVKIKRYEILFEENGIKQCTPQEATNYYEQQLSIGHFFIPEAQQVIKKLSAGYRLYIVTNGSKKVQQGRIKSSGIGKYLDNIFVSEEIGYEKPASEFFEKCFLQIPDFKKDETVIVGDSLSSDIKGGQNAGIKTIWFNRNNAQNGSDVIPDYEISSLSRIECILQQIY